MADDQTNPMAGGMGAAQGQGAGQANIDVQEDKNMARLYGNAFSAQVTGNDVILDIGATDPGQNPVKVNVVGRVYMTHQTAASLVNLLNGALKNYQERAQASQAAQAQGGEQVMPPSSEMPAA